VVDDVTAVVVLSALIAVALLTESFILRKRRSAIGARISP
jgi:hypothetical protein